MNAKNKQNAAPMPQAQEQAQAQAQAADAATIKNPAQAQAAGIVEKIRKGKLRVPQAQAAAQVAEKNAERKQAKAADAKAKYDDAKAKYDDADTARMNAKTAADVAKAKAAKAKAADARKLAKAKYEQTQAQTADAAKAAKMIRRAADAAKAADDAAKAEQAKAQAAKSAELRKSPEQAKAEYEQAQAKAADAAKDAKEQRTNADAAAELMKRRRIDLAFARTDAGTGTPEDAAVIAENAAELNAADVLAQAAELFAALRKEKAFKNAFADVHAETFSLSRACKDVQKMWAKYAVLFDAAAVSIKREDVTPALFNVAKNAYLSPFLMVATKSGVKVGALARVHINIITAWNAEKVALMLIVNHILKHLCSTNKQAQAAEKKQYDLIADAAAKLQAAADAVTAQAKAKAAKENLTKLQAADAVTKSGELYAAQEQAKQAAADARKARRKAQKQAIDALKAQAQAEQNAAPMQKQAQANAAALAS